MEQITKLVFEIVIVITCFYFLFKDLYIISLKKRSQYHANEIAKLEEKRNELKKIIDGQITIPFNLLEINKRVIVDLDEIFKIEYKRNVEDKDQSIVLKYRNGDEETINEKDLKFKYEIMNVKTGTSVSMMHVLFVELCYFINLRNKYRQDNSFRIHESYYTISLKEIPYEIDFIDLKKEANKKNDKCEK